MTYTASPHDDTADARQALLNRFAGLRRMYLAKSSPSPRTDRRNEPATCTFSPSPLNPPSRTSPPPEAITRGVRYYDNPKPRPSNYAFGTLWDGLEPDVDNTFFHWDGSLLEIPTEAFAKALRNLEAGKYVGFMSPESKAALVHAITREMLHDGIPPTDATVGDIRHFLVDSYDTMERHNRPFGVQDRVSSSCSSLQDRRHELEWLLYQATLRWWTLTRRQTEDIDRRRTEPSDSEMEALFDAYTNHADLPPNSWT